LERHLSKPKREDELAKGRKEGRKDKRKRDKSKRDKPRTSL